MSAILCLASENISEMTVSQALTLEKCLSPEWEIPFYR
jgi:hypothetical protein